MEKCDRVRYLGNTTDEQVRWGNNDDPRVHLVAGEIYMLSRVEVHSWHTKFFIADKDGLECRFNSVNFEYVPEEPTFKVGDIIEGHKGRYTVEGELG